MAFAELSTLSLDRGAHFVALRGDIEIGVRLVVEVVMVGRPALRDPQRAAIDVWGPPPAAFSIMQALKERFDPEGRLAPGRFVGGI